MQMTYSSWIKRVVGAALVLQLIFGGMSDPSSAEPAPSNQQSDSMLSGFTLGLGGGLISNEYKDMQGDTTILPLLGYESK